MLSCSTLEQSISEKKTSISVQVGANKGGMTENTDMSVVFGVKVPPEATVDAFTGATQIGINVGVHINQRLKRNQVETGLDYMYDFQKFNYIDVGNHYLGVRDLHVSQFMIPLTYNIAFPKAALQFKIGLLGQFNLLLAKGTGILPNY